LLHNTLFLSSMQRLIAAATRSQSSCLVSMERWGFY